MPYITQHLRNQIDPALEALCIAVIKMKNEDDKHIIPGPGVWNYIISKLLYLNHAPHGYSQGNEIVGILECVKQEYYRRVMAPYEDQKILENGDVY